MTEELSHEEVARLEEMMEGEDPIACLYAAVVNYVKDKGGKVLMVGPSFVLNKGRDYSYGVGVHVTGRKPGFAEETEDGQEAPESSDGGGEESTVGDVQSEVQVAT